MSFPNCIFEIYKIFTYECIKTIRCRRRYLNKNTLPAFGPRRGNFWISNTRSVMHTTLSCNEEDTLHSNSNSPPIASIINFADVLYSIVCPCVMQYVPWKFQTGQKPYEELILLTNLNIRRWMDEKRCWVWWESFRGNRILIQKEKSSLSSRKRGNIRLIVDSKV